MIVMLMMVMVIVIMMVVTLIVMVIIVILVIVIPDPSLLPSFLFRVHRPSNLHSQGSVSFAMDQVLLA